MKIIQLGRESAAEFWRLRLLLFKELGEVADDTNPHGLEAATRAYYFAHTGKDLVTWGVPDGEQLAAIGSLSLFERAPYQENPTGKEGHLFNIYNLPGHSRKAGICDSNRQRNHPVRFRCFHQALMAQQQRVRKTDIRTMRVC